MPGVHQLACTTQSCLFAVYNDTDDFCVVCVHCACGLHACNNGPPFLTQDLMETLKHEFEADIDTSSIGFAQYDPAWRLIGRHNEIHIRRSHSSSRRNGE